jgi:hypothetical protein
MTEQEGPSPWLPPTITNAKERAEIAKQKAHREETLAEMTQQVNTMIGEYCELHFLLTVPKRVLQTTETSKASSANVQLQTELELSANIQLQTD